MFDIWKSLHKMETGAFRIDWTFQNKKWDEKWEIWSSSKGKTERTSIFEAKLKSILYHFEGNQFGRKYKYHLVILSFFEPKERTSISSISKTKFVSFALTKKKGLSKFRLKDESSFSFSLLDQFLSVFIFLKTFAFYLK